MRGPPKGVGTGGVRVVPSGLLQQERTPYRALALAAAATLLATLLSLLYGVVQVSGDPTALLIVAALSLVAATVLASVLAVRTAVIVAGVSLVGGLFIYTNALPYDPLFADMVASNIELLSGRSILFIRQSDIWALSVTPGLVFATWYLTLRGWYESAAIAGFAGVGYFVLTGDAGTTTALIAVLAAVALVGFGDLASRGASAGAAEMLAAVLAVMVVTPLLISVVPGGAVTPLSLGGRVGGDGQPSTVEASLVSTGSQIDVTGTIELSDADRFTIESPEAHNWRVASYDRYVGDGWIRTGSVKPYPRRTLSPPDGETRRIEQRVTAESSIKTMPAAWRPVSLQNTAGLNPQVAPAGGLAPGTTLEAGDSYRVTSAVQQAGPVELPAVAGTDPADLHDQYTQLPRSTPGRVDDLAATVTAGARTRFETARAVESWLRANRDYSLTVDKPAGDVADAFLFEMEQGYCVYYATTMVVMLRTQDVPARLTVGYTPGEEIQNDTYRVRGYNSHAWVEVYFPEHGWVAFDPTPPGPRREAEQAQVADPTETDNDAVTPVPIGPALPRPGTTPAAPASPDTPTPTEATPASGDAGGFSLPPLPSRQQVLLLVVVLVGTVAGVRQTDLLRRVYRWVWLRYQPRRDPETDVERAYQRVAYILERRYRPRQPGETVHQYLDAVHAKSRERRVATLRERARHGPGISRSDADTAIRLVEAIRSDENGTVWQETN